MVKGALDPSQLDRKIPKATEIERRPCMAIGLKVYTALPLERRKMEPGGPMRRPVASAPTDEPSPSISTPVVTPSPDNAELTAEVNSWVLLFKSSLPFIIILLLRFLLSYAARIAFLALIATIQYRLSTELNYQISLKSFAQQRRNWTLFGASFLLFLLVLLVSPSIFQEQLWTRYLLFPYEKPEMDFIGVLWFAALTDLSVKCALTTFKLGMNLFLSRHSSSTARNHPITLPPPPSSLSDYLQSGLSAFAASLCRALLLLLR
jgi:hypothetical protein